MEQEKKFKRRPNRTFPIHTIQDALVIAKTIQDDNAAKPMKRLLVADAIGRKPTTIQFRDLLSSSYKYGLTVGSEKSEYIELTEIGKQITKPISEKQKIEAIQKVAVTPELFNKILSHYRDAKWPKGQFFENALEVEFGVPREYIKEVLDILGKNGKFSGLLRTISGSLMVMFDDYSSTENGNSQNGELDSLNKEYNGNNTDQSDGGSEGNTSYREEEHHKKNENTSFILSKKKRVYITHGKNVRFIEPIKKLLQFGELDAIVSAEKQSVSQPVTDKVMNDMRSCGAAIIHVDDEKKMMDKDAKEVIVINPNVLIEIGAAMALYGRRFILLIKNGISLPSNLTGLYEVRYDGDSLDGDVTIKLLEAINDMKKVPHPSEETAIKN